MATVSYPLRIEVALLIVIPADRVDEFTQARVERDGHVVRAITVDEHLAANINAACREIGREVGYRRSCYPRWVQQGRMTPDQASEQIGDLELAARLLRELSGVQR